jgi:cysteine desulfurase/selenocysteine lyase
MVLDKMGIAVRTGTHCTQPVMDHFGIDGTVRVSLAFYNTEAEMEALSQGIIRARRMFL